MPESDSPKRREKEPESKKRKGHDSKSLERKDRDSESPKRKERDAESRKGKVRDSESPKRKDRDDDSRKRKERDSDSRSKRKDRDSESNKRKDRDSDTRKRKDRDSDTRKRKDRDSDTRKRRDHDSDSRKRRDRHHDRDSENQKRKEPEVDSQKRKEPVAESRKQKELNALTTRTGGAYIPPAKLRMMQKSIEDKSSAEYQRLAWEQLKKSINGLINKVNTSNLTTIVRELIKQNLVRGRGLLCRSIMQAQSASQTFTNVYAALVGIINSKFPNIGELLLKRLVIQFRRGYKRNDKPTCLAAARFIGHLVNQQVAHEVLALEVLTLLLEHPTEDSVEVAVGFLKEVGCRLEEVSPRGAHAIFERLRQVLHEGQLEKRVQYMIEVMFQVRKDKFKDFPTLPEELDLVEEEDQFTHLLTLDEVTDGQDILNVFKLDEEFIQNEEKYATLRKEILDESEDEGSGADGEDEDDDEEEEEKEAGNDTIIDQTDTNLLTLRRTIYLTIQSSLDFEECCHKILRLNMKDGQEIELCHMILDCCAQQRTYEKFFGLLAQRFCNLNIGRKYIEPFQNIFKDTYETVHRLDTNKLRNVAKFFAHLLYTDAISWTVLEHIKLTEDETTSSSRIFIKILMQELSEFMGLQKLNQRLQVLNIERDADTYRDELRDFLKKQPKPTAVIAPQRNESPESDAASSSSSSSSSGSSSSSSSSDSSSSGSSSDSSSSSSSDSDSSSSSSSDSDSSSSSSSDSDSSSSSSDDDSNKKRKKKGVVSNKKKRSESVKAGSSKHAKGGKSKRSRSRSPIYLKDKHSKKHKKEEGGKRDSRKSSERDHSKKSKKNDKRSKKKESRSPSKTGKDKKKQKSPRTRDFERLEREALGLTGEESLNLEDVRREVALRLRRDEERSGRAEEPLLQLLHNQRLRRGDERRREDLEDREINSHDRSQPNYRDEREHRRGEPQEDATIIRGLAELRQTFEESRKVQDPRSSERDRTERSRRSRSGERDRRDRPRRSRSGERDRRDRPRRSRSGERDRRDRSRRSRSGERESRRHRRY